MPKLPSLTPQKVIKILEKKGFILDRTKGSHHIYYHPETRRRVVVPLSQEIDAFNMPRFPFGVKGVGKIGRGMV